MKSGNRNFALIPKGLLSTSLAFAMCLGTFGKCARAQKQNPQIDLDRARTEVKISAREIEKLAVKTRTVLTTIHTQAQSIEAAARSSDQPVGDRLTQISSLSESIDRLATSVSGSATAIKRKAGGIRARVRELDKADEIGSAARTIEEAGSSLLSGAATISSQARAIKTLAARQSSPQFDEIDIANQIILELSALNIDTAASLFLALSQILGAVALIQQRFDEILRKIEKDTGGPQNTDARPRNRPAQTSTPDVDYSRVDLFGGFTIQREDGEPDGFNLYGWNAAATLNVKSKFGIKADTSGVYRSENGTSIKRHSFLAGPQLSARQRSVRVFAHALLGLAHVNADTDLGDGDLDPNARSGDKVTLKPAVLSAGFSDTAFAMAYGGGLDLRLNRRLMIRLAQLDYQPTRFGENWQHNFRFSTGLVFNFGHGRQ